MKEAAMKLLVLGAVIGAIVVGTLPVSAQRNIEILLQPIGE
jgi:hypothetical protein